MPIVNFLDWSGRDIGLVFAAYSGGSSAVTNFLTPSGADLSTVLNHAASPASRDAVVGFRRSSDGLDIAIQFDGAFNFNAYFFDPAYGLSAVSTCNGTLLPDGQVLYSFSVAPPTVVGGTSPYRYTFSVIGSTFTPEITPDPVNANAYYIKCVAPHSVSGLFRCGYTVQDANGSITVSEVLYVKLLSP